MRSVLFTVGCSLAAVTSALAMSPADLSPQELIGYNAVANNPANAKSYLDTRDYFHACLRVKNKQLAIKDLPAPPDDYDERYLSKDEEAVVEESTYAWIILRMSPKK